jgi:hypothetical protein
MGCLFLFATRDDDDYDNLYHSANYNGNNNNDDYNGTNDDNDYKPGRMYGCSVDQRADHHQR